MRPVRFVALSEDGQALVLADEVGRLLTLPIDDRVSGAVRQERSAPRGQFASGDPAAAEAALSPRDIQSRIRSGESAEEVARIAGVPVDRVLRYAGPVLQERAMLAQHARRTRLRNSDRGATLAEVVDARLTQHGVDADGVSWDAYRADDATWRITASWASGKATAQAVWALDKARQVATPTDDMAQFLSAERPAPLLGQDPAPEEPTPRGGHALTRPEPRRAPAEPPRPGAGHGLGAIPRRDPVRRLADVRETLERPLHEPATAPGRPDDAPGAPVDGPGAPAAAAGVEAPTEPGADESAIGRSLPGVGMPRHGGAVPLGDRGGDGPSRTRAEPLRPTGERAEPLRPTGSAGPSEPRRSVSETREPGGFDDEPDAKEMPVVPSLAVLRPRRSDQGATGSERSRLPSWDDVLFGNGGKQNR